MDRRTFIAAATSAAAVTSIAHAAEPRFTVEVKGSGPDVILIPGLTSSRTVWDGVAAHLQGKYRLHLVQLGGFAGAPTAGNKDGLVAAGVAEELAAYITAKGLKKPAVIGHSMGGTMGLMLAARHPDLVGRLMVIDMFPKLAVAFFGPTATPEQVTAGAAAIKAGLESGPQAEYEARTRQTIAGMVKTESAREEIVRQGITSDRSVQARSMHEILTTDLTPELTKITAPLTVVYPTDSTLPFTASYPAWYAGAYASVKGAKLVQVDGSYHFIMIDQPAALNAAIDSFLAG
ncbi:alpha/beta hydrolase [Caulobacter segnis]|uniref:alpha/beta fold hydrolase n=1 Tax=Caulobacter segnis TaxID=88688 RepID=UPI002410764D|nr:alpha/beta hydrolase [Caulobacter segnis]MDG2520022.1 alpha/beta hydrolase [Caulobacter segnis]